MSECPSMTVLERYCGGELAAEQDAAVDQHMKGCVACAAGVQAIRERFDRLVNRVKGLSLSGPIEPNVAPPPSLPSSPPPTGLPDMAFEGYEILRELHRGGQGVIYQAVQKSTKRRVAIKVLLEGQYASDSSRRRFEREIELVASLKHPNIVSVFDSGRTRDGRDYCVMDYVQGERLESFIKIHALGLRDCLRLFCHVCDAVNFAHQRGVIHRDLKPWNIVVESDGQPKILDFGLAKTVAGTVDPLVSMTGQVVGTMPYLSPEQARGKLDEVDTRTDIYALGVMIYEILTGVYPYNVTGEVPEVLHNITNTPPAPLRKAWTPMCGVRPDPPHREGECPIDDELETIVLKALAKERERRYQSAGELARDMMHYMGGEPIEAKRDSAWYLVRKTLSRHKVAVRAVVGLFAASLVFGVAMAWLWTRALAAEELAENRAREAQLAHSAEVDARKATEAQVERTAKVAAFLDATMRAVDPWKHPGRDLGPLREMLDAAVQRLEGSFPDQPQVEAALAGTLGWDYWKLGLYDSAEKLLRRSYELNRAELGEDNSETILALNNLATLLTDQGKYSESTGLFERLLDLERKAKGPENWTTLRAMNNLALNLDWQGRSVEAEALFRTALEAQTRLFGPHDSARLDTLNNLAACLPSLGKTAEAETLYRELVDARTAAQGADHPETLQARMNHAQFVNTSGHAAEAEKLLRDLLVKIESALGPGHPLTITATNNLAGAVSSLGRLDEGLALARKAYDAQVAFAGTDHPTTLLRKNEFVNVLIEKGRWEEAIPLAQELKEQYTRAFGAENPRTLIVTGNLAFAFNKAGWHEAAEKIWKQIVAIGETSQESNNVAAQIPSPIHEAVVTAHANLGALYADQNRWTEAEIEFRAAIALQVGMNDADHWRTAWMRAGLGRVLTETNRLDEANEVLVSAHATLREALGEDHDKTHRAAEFLARLREKQSPAGG